jgi:hypothetical protein
LVLVIWMILWVFPLPVQFRFPYDVPSLKEFFA